MNKGVIYYALINNVYYRFFVFKEYYKGTRNDFLKLSFLFDPPEHRKIRTDEYTVHPNIIAKKTIFPKNTILIGDFKDKERGVEQETLYPGVGYGNAQECLLKLFDITQYGGFYGRKEYSFDNLKNSRKIIKFPDDPYRPYWISAYFTTYSQTEINTIFESEDLDEIIYLSGDRGNIVVLLKYIVPEWETLGIQPEDEDKLQIWTHPTYALETDYYVLTLNRL